MSDPNTMEVIDANNTSTNGPVAAPVEDAQHSTTGYTGCQKLTKIYLEQAISDYDIIPDGEFVAVSMKNKDSEDEIRIFSKNTRQCVETITFQDGGINDIQLGPSSSSLGRYVLVSISFRWIRLWYLDEKAKRNIAAKSIAQLMNPHPSRCYDEFHSKTGALIQDGSLLVYMASGSSVHKRNSIEVWDAQRRRRCRAIYCPSIISPHYTCFVTDGILGETAAISLDYTLLA
ncbi:uncharacterized protein BDV14DRAFT_202771 [Aspergillus stella-maris]|uniref:uncharacterized protein n=1 Tax=Aspergillus stella-maris TaxID=1810926 RepID=UPI003CCC9D65